MPCFDPRERDSQEHARKGMAAACVLLGMMIKGELVLAGTATLPQEIITWWAEHRRRDETAGR